MSEYAGNLKPKYIYGAGLILFGTDRQPSGTCSYFKRYFRFDATTPAGKNLLTILLMAKASDRSVDVWYNKSSAEGKNETNGATKNNVSVLVQIGVTN